jgi:hypothetical protein
MLNRRDRKEVQEQLGAALQTLATAPARRPQRHSSRTMGGRRCVVIDCAPVRRCRQVTWGLTSDEED